MKCRSASLRRQQLRATVHQRQQVHAEGRLQRRLLVELVEDDLLGSVPAQLDHDAHALAVRLVPQVGDAVDPAFANQIGDPLEQRRLVHHEGNLGDDDPRAALGLLELGPRAHREQARGPWRRPSGCPRSRRSSRRSENPGPASSRAGRRACSPDCAPRGPARRRARAGCAAGCWWPCRRRCPRSRSPAGSGSASAAPPAPRRCRRSSARSRPSRGRCPAASPRRAA